jgi:RNA polymerase sigma-70 factor, ECF subfamily
MRFDPALEPSVHSESKNRARSHSWAHSLFPPAPTVSPLASPPARKAPFDQGAFRALAVWQALQPRDAVVRWGIAAMTSQQEQQATALIVRAQQGDGVAYAELLTMLASTARQYARNRLGDVPWLDDVAQETLLTIHAARRTYDPARPFAPWFYAILSSRMIDVLRKERRVSARELATDVLPEPPSHPASARDGSDVVDPEHVRAALKALPDRQREVVSALKLRDESVREISERLGMSQSAVKVTAHRGYKALRRLLGSKES